MNYLLDTNIILELLLEQEQADEVERLLRTVSPATLFLSEFTLFSLGIILFKHKRHDVFLQMLKDLLGNGIQVIRIAESEMPNIVVIARQFSLDFDDAYQYAISKSRELILVSYDRDFDKTPEKRMIPEEII